MLALALLLAAAAPAAGAPEKVSTLLVYGNDPCPKGNGDEIVVCARRPEGERYRIPKRLRETKPIPAQLSWAGTAEQLDRIGRGGQMPNSCSPDGSNGQTGCFQAFMRQARQERQQAAEDAADIP